MASGTTFAARLIGQFCVMVFKDVLHACGVLLTNATFQNLIIFVARAVIKGTLTLTHSLIKFSASDGNPMVKLVTKEIEQVPTSKIMTSSKGKGRYTTTRSVLQESTREVKLVSMSCVTVLLTWIIKAATSTRRNLIGSIAEHNKQKQQE